MGFFSDIFSKRNTTEVIDIETAFNIWNLLYARYQSVEGTQLFKGLIHDKELIAIVTLLLDNFATQVKELEIAAERFKLKLPTRPPSDFKLTIQINEVTDRFIYSRLLGDLLTEIFSLSRSVRTTFTNDRMRNVFSQFLTKHFEQYEALFMYGKLKGWEEVPPSYKTNNPQGNEPLAVSESYHLWHHISMRYQQLELTMFYQSYVHDEDFKAGMISAVDTLKEQIDKLEKIALSFEVPLPPRPPASLVSAVDPEVIEDRFIFQQIFLGIESMLDNHIGAIVEIPKNDNLRGVFIKLLEHETDIHDTMIKYGKVKGWVNLPPTYNQALR